MEISPGDLERVITLAEKYLHWRRTDTATLKIGKNQ